jgi:hypothetical protein
MWMAIVRCDWLLASHKVCGSMRQADYNKGVTRMIKAVRMSGVCNMTYFQSEKSHFILPPHYDVDNDGKLLQIVSIEHPLTALPFVVDFLLKRSCRTSHYNLFKATNCLSRFCIFIPAVFVIPTTSSITYLVPAVQPMPIILQEYVH